MAAEADACAKQLTATLRGRLAGQAGDAAECIQLMRQLGEPVENLQVRAVVGLGRPKVTGIHCHGHVLRRLKRCAAAGTVLRHSDPSEPMHCTVRSASVDPQEA